MAASPREQVEGALKHLGFKPSQVRAGLAALPPGDARPLDAQIKEALRHVDDAPSEPAPAKPAPKAPPKIEPAPSEPAPKAPPAKATNVGGSIVRRSVEEPRRVAVPAARPSSYMRRANETQKNVPRTAREVHKLSGLPSVKHLVLAGISIGLPLAALLVFGRESSRDDAPPSPTAPASGGAPPPKAQPRKRVKVVLPRAQKGVNANLRDEPSPIAAVVAGVQPGTEATVLESRTLKTGTWYRVEVVAVDRGQVTGWMHGSLLPGASA